MAALSEEKSSNAGGEPILKLTSLGHPLLRFILSLIDQTSLPQVRLVNHLVKQLVDETITRYTFGTAPKYSGLEELRAEVTHAGRLWPAMKEIKVLSPSMDPNILAEGQSRGDLAIEALLDANWTDIQVLDCSNCWLGPAAGVPLARCSLLNKNLRTLNLNRNGLSATGIKNLASGDFPMLEQLDLGQNGLGPDGGAPLAKLLSRCPNLRELDLDWNYLQDDLGLIFKPENCSLLKLGKIVLGGNSLSNGNAILLGAAKWPSLHTLILGDNDLKEADIHALCQGEWPLLEILEIVSLQNLIGVEGAASLRDAVCLAAPKWPLLRSLDISGSLESMESLRVLLEGEWKALDHLVLDLNSLGIEGSRILASAYNNNRHRLPALTSLNLYQTDIDAPALSELFSVCWRTLKRLELGGEVYNETTGAAGAAVAAAVLENRLPLLKEFCLNNFGSGTGYLEMFKVAWKELEVLGVTECVIGLEGVMALVEATESNRLPKLRLLTLWDLEYIEYLEDNVDGNGEFKEIKLEAYGGVEGIKMLLNAEWPSLEKLMVTDVLDFLRAQENGVEKWRVAGEDAEERNTLERILKTNKK